RDNGAVAFSHWPVFGMLLPDTIRLYETGGETYIVTANEGHAREYDAEGWWSEGFEIRRLRLNPEVFPDAAELQHLRNIGRLVVTSTLGATGCNPSYSSAQVQALGFDDIRAYVGAL